MIIHNNNQADIDSTQHSNITHDLQHPPCFYSVFCYLATMSDCLDSFTFESGLKSCIPSARTAPLPLGFFTGSSFFIVFSLSYISKSLLANTFLTSSQCLENFFYVVTALCACVNMFAAYWPSKLIGIFFGYSPIYEIAFISCYHNRYTRQVLIQLSVPLLNFFETVFIGNIINYTGTFAVSIISNVECMISFLTSSIPNGKTNGSFSINLYIFGLIRGIDRRFLLITEFILAVFKREWRFSNSSYWLNC